MRTVDCEQPLYYEFEYPESAYAAIHPALCAYFEAQQSQQQARKTHWFGGRYENIYLDAEGLPGINKLLQFWTQCAAFVLPVEPGALRCGFWFNWMQPGQVTSPHSHDDDDECLSGVYYLKVPGQSGDLILHDGDACIHVTPRQGKLVLFSASTLHEVSENNSQYSRLSIGMNFGLTGS